MATIGEIVDGLEAAIDDTGLRPWDGDGDFTPPAFIVQPESGAPRTLGAVKETQDFRVLVAVSTASTRIARDQLDAYLSPTGTLSIRAALTANKHLGLSGVVAVYRGWENYGLIEINGAVYLGAHVLVTVEN